MGAKYTKKKGYSFKRKLYVKGDQIGKCLFIEEIEYGRKAREPRLMVVQCPCGNEFKAKMELIEYGKVCKKCEHINRSVSKTFHGRVKTKEYRTWQGMKKRCTDIDYPKYKRYGGRGIKVCERWLEKFENFFEDMGHAPTKDHSIGRIDNDGNYEPSNCRWETDKEQARNRRTSAILTFNGFSRTIAEWSELVGLSQGTIWTRINVNKWSIEDSLTKPIQKIKGRLSPRKKRRR